MRRTSIPRGRVGACALTLALVGASLGVGSGALADDGPRYSGSEQVPTGVTPPPPQSAFAGESRNAPTLVAESRVFGQYAKAAGVGVKTYRYSSKYGNASTLDVYTPRPFRGKQGRKVRTAILVHGGAWQKGDRIDLEPQSVQLAKLGLVVVSVNYRLATEAPWPAQRDDVDAAVRYVRERHRKFNVDNKRTALIGSSAGGQIAAAVATRGDGSKRFRGLVTFSGLVDPRLMADLDPTYSNAVIPGLLLRCLPLDCPERYDSATAATQLDGRDMPSLLFHSESERPWDVAQARAFVRASRAVGVPSTLVVPGGNAHGIDTWARHYPKLREFLLTHLGRKDR